MPLGPIPVPKTELGRQRLTFGILYALCLFTVLLGLWSLHLESQDDQRIKDIAKAQKASCAAQGVAFGGILANLGLFLETAQQLKSAKSLPPEVRGIWGAMAGPLTATLDAQFKKPPRCGEHFEFTIEITGQERRHVETPGRTPSPSPTPSPTP